MPIKSQDIIHNFFDSDIEKKLYFHINYDTYKKIQDRCKAYYPFIGTTFFRKHKSIKILSLMLGKIQILFGVNRLKNSPFAPLYNGWTWFSIPLDFAEYVVEKRGEITKTFSKTLASDEVFIQSVAMHSPFADRVYGYNGKDDPIDASKRINYYHIENPLELLNNPNVFFARKFYEETQKDVIDLVYEKIKQEQKEMIE